MDIWPCPVTGDTKSKSKIPASRRNAAFIRQIIRIYSRYSDIMLYIE
jgi:hypothetical protein